MSYINPLLQRFSQKTDFQVVFCVNKPHKEKELQGVKYTFLSRADDRKKWDGNDSKIVQPEVIKLIRKGGYDLLFINNSYTSPTTWFALLAAKLKGIPAVTRMTAGLSNKKSLPIMMAKRIVVGLYCRLVDAALYECEDQRDYCIEYGLKEEQLFFAPSVVDNDYFYSQKLKYEKKQMRERLNIPDNVTTLIYTGRLIPLKRLLDIIYAVEKLSKGGYDLVFLILGDGEEKEKIEKYIENNNLESNIMLCGGMDHEEMSKYLCASDIYVLASERDKSPKALSEAMNFELPIIISDRVNNAHEMCEEGVNGYIFKKGDVGQLYGYLKGMIEHKEKLEKMGKESRRIVSKYTFDGVVDAWMEAATYALRKRNDRYV